MIQGQNYASLQTVGQEQVAAAVAADNAVAGVAQRAAETVPMGAIAADVP